MEIKRFFITNSDIIDNYVLIQNEEFEHMTRVLRYKVGYQFIACPNDGLDYYCTIMNIDKKFVKAKIDYVEKNTAFPLIDVRLYQAIPKGDKLDLIVQKTVELGLESVVPFKSQFTNETKFNQTRMDKISKDASKQCGRAKLMKVNSLVDFDTMLDMAFENDIVIMPYENATCGKISRIRNLKQAKSIGIIIGSEGGFSEEEVLKAKKRGARIVSLGKRILRCETAAIVASTLVMYEMGELSQ